MIQLTPAHIESLSQYLQESIEEFLFEPLEAKDIAEMISMYVAGDIAADEEWFDKNQAP